MEALLYLTSTVFLVWTIKNIVTWTLLWQDKSYDWRRVFYSLCETAKGKNILFSPLSIIKWLAFIVYIYTIFEEKYILIFQSFIVLVYILQAFFVIKNLLKNNKRRPIFNRESILTILFSSISLLTIYSFPLLDKFFWILFIDRITPVIVSFFVVVVSFPLELIQDREIEKAKEKIKKQKDLMTIGIVGSYGKSSTKEFLYQLLTKNYKVVRSSGHQGRLPEIANTVLKKIKKSTQIFIVEMNDFSKGDIKNITEVVKPSIGIITGVNPQYLSLFRTLKESVASKAELINSLSKKSLVLFNGNDNELIKLYTKNKKTKKLYLLEKNDKSKYMNDSIYAENKEVLFNSIKFDAVIGNRKIKIKSPLLGLHNIENLLPAIYIADYLGIDEKTIKNISLSLRPPKNTMVKKINENGAIFIDDTTNTNPESVLAALDYMKLYKKKKMVVMQTMIELGKEAKNIHLKIAERISRECDVLFLTNTDYARIIHNVLSKKENRCKFFNYPPEKIAEYINTNTKKGDIILYEGNDSKTILDRLL